MINDIGDIVEDKHGRLYLIADIRIREGTYLFRLHSLGNWSPQEWFEPFSQQLAPAYWQTLA